MSTSIPILMYHQVTRRPIPAFRKYSVTATAFTAHMAWLALAGYTPLTLDAVLDCRRGRRSLPVRPVVITFDDGFQECVELTAPVLRAKSFTAVFYLVAGLMGQTSRWLAEKGLDLPLMSWAMARQLVADGFQCGSHSLSHPHLADLSADDCYQELQGARVLLEDNLGAPVAHLAYPYGSFSPAVRGLAAEAGYQTACSVEIGLSPSDDDLLALHRVPITGHDSLIDFIVRLKTARTARETVRGTLLQPWRQATRGYGRV